ncbi:type II secretion system F family protein [Vallitalea okinawensis]|uniref:type II secretion system F family protein n=1 Tax=Vallitalea okinawensis TaxID=2078660 RepID=UPI000CFD1AE2|nr:type II secretion system F family protein [Vallitalea okinawensis]
MGFILGLLIILIILTIGYLIVGKDAIKHVLAHKLGDKKSTDASSEIDYNDYQLTQKELVIYFLILSSILFALGYIYYHHVWIAIIFSSIGIYLMKFIKRYLRDKRKKQLINEFKEGLYALNTALGAGRSLEQGFRVACEEMDQDANPLIAKEFTLIIHKMDANETVEGALIDFANRSHIEDIKNFADILVTCKRTEGDVMGIIKRTMTMIAEKIQVRREIETHIAQKKFEQRILMVMPAAVIVFLSMTSEGLLEPMFTTVVGRGIMTGALIANIICYFISAKIIDIEV